MTTRMNTRGLGPWSLEPFSYFAEVAPSKPYPIISLLEDFRHTKEFPLTMDHDPHHTSLGNKVSRVLFGSIFSSRAFSTACQLCGYDVPLIGLPVLSR